MPTASSKGKARRPDLDTVFTINADGSRNFLHPADVRGTWTRRKNFTFFVLIAIYVLVPWIEIGGHPAVNIDIPGRAAFLFGQTFTNQDFYLLFFLVSGMGFALFVVTSLWGRIWCGYACPQSVFLEGVFRRVERWVEGPRDARIRRNLGPWTFGKAQRKVLKHALFIVLAFLNAHVFVAYFIAPRELIAAMTGPPAEHWAAFLWVTAWTAILYFDFAWFREQTCLILCPYGRLQSALVDADTIVIGYDETRGEPRSKRTTEGGDCIDCYKCVAACPTGIDIRNGLQMECVGCANCIDACDEVMARVDRPKGLVRYDSQRGLGGEARQRFFRPRVFLYAALGLLGLAVFGFTSGRRSSFEVHVLRTRGMPYVIDEGHIRNVYAIRIQNKGNEPGVFRVTAQTAEGQVPPEIIVAQTRLGIASLGDATTPIVATLGREDWTQAFPITVAVTDSATGRVRNVEVRFRGP
jgi:cytochrome c oxidase accessory protein FixG